MMRFSQYLMVILNVSLSLTKAGETGIQLLVSCIFVSFFLSLSIFLTHFWSVFYQYIREIINFSNVEVGLSWGEAQNIRVVTIHAINLCFLSCSPQLLFPLLPQSHGFFSHLRPGVPLCKEECNRLLHWSICHPPGFFSSFSYSPFPMLLTMWKSSPANHFLAFHRFHGEIWGSPSASARLITIIASNACFSISHHSMHLLGR